jgi:hypothetical protein
VNYSCDRCQDRTVVGGFLPAPCPSCRPSEQDKERDSLRSRVAELEQESRPCPRCGPREFDSERIELESERNTMRTSALMAEQERDQWRSMHGSEYAMRREAESQRDSALARLAFVEGQRNLLHTEMESIRFLANKALGDSMFAVPPAMTAPDVARCTVCRWPLAESMEQGCVPGNCSYRPRTKGTPDHG